MPNTWVTPVPRVWSPLLVAATLTALGLCAPAARAQDVGAETPPEAVAADLASEALQQCNQRLGEIERRLSALGIEERFARCSSDRAALQAAQRRLADVVGQLEEQAAQALALRTRIREIQETLDAAREEARTLRLLEERVAGRIAASFSEFGIDERCGETLSVRLTAEGVRVVGALRRARERAARIQALFTEQTVTPLIEVVITPLDGCSAAVGEDWEIELSEDGAPVLFNEEDIRGLSADEIERLPTVDSCEEIGALIDDAQPGRSGFWALLIEPDGGRFLRPCRLNSAERWVFTDDIQRAWWLVRRSSD